MAKCEGQVDRGKVLDLSLVQIYVVLPRTKCPQEYKKIASKISVSEDHCSRTEHTLRTSCQPFTMDQSGNCFGVPLEHNNRLTRERFLTISFLY